MTSRPFTIAILLAIAISFVPFDLDARGRRVRIDGIEGTWRSVDPPLVLFGNQTTTFQIPMILAVGTSTYSHITIYENGFVSFSDGAAGPVVDPQLGATSLAAIPGDVFAMLYADLECDDARTPGDACEMDYAELDLIANPDDAPEEGNPIVFLKAVRVGWGSDNSRAGVINPLEDPPTEPADDLVSFQMRIIDRSDETYGTGTVGDFDLELGYLASDADTVNWSLTPLVAGISAGGVLLDFESLGSFLNNVDPTGLAVDCRGAPEPVPGSPNERTFVSFDPVYPLPCNFITIEFRGGTPELKTFTSDMAVSFVTAPSTVNAAEDFSLVLQVDNAGPDTADNVAVSMDVPSSTSLRGTEPSSAQCSLANNTVSCNLPDIEASASTLVSVFLQQAADGQFDYAAGVMARQYDARTVDNSASASIAVEPSADVSIVSCSVSPTTITNGGIVTASCVLRNNGPQDATNLRLAVGLPTIVNFTSSSDCELVNANLQCDIATLASGSQITVAANLTSAAAGGGVFTATLSADQNDQDTTDNGPVQASLTVTNPVVVPPIVNGGGGGGGGSFAPPFLICLLLAITCIRCRRSQL